MELQRNAADGVRDNKHLLKAVFDTSTEGILVIDKNVIIQASNPAATEMFGYEAHEMLGHNIGMLMPDLDRLRHDFHFGKYPRSGVKNAIGRSRKLEGLRKNGEAFRYELTIADASINRDVLFIVLVRDLTQIESEMLKTEAARAELLHVARLSDMGQVAAGLAHEVSQPLTAIRTLASVGRHALSSATDPAIAQVIEVIETQAKNATDILKRLRGFIEKRESRRFPENLTELIEEALALASVRSHGRPVRILSNMSPVDIDVDVDRVQILQVLVNFLRNASDALVDQPDPEVVIETLLEKPGVVRVNVSDNGPGVDPKIADRLFTPFVTTKSYGMGIGLSLCKSIIESHKGEIGCAANTPKGATFWFTLPVVERAGPADTLASGAARAVQ
jgi:two-component system sensor kinase FixL